MSKSVVSRLVLAGIVAIALGLRIWGITFGLPYVYHYDERFYVHTALNLGAGVLNNPPYNPTGLSNILFPQYAAYYLVGKVMGVFTSPQSFEAAYRSDPTVFYLSGRLTTALFGAATVLVLYMLGKVASGPQVGLVAAGLLAVSFLHVRDSHYAVPDIAMSLLIVLAVALAAAGARHERRREVYLAGLAGGFGVAMKWTGFPVAAAVWWASVCIEHKGHESVLGKLVNRTVVIAVLCLALGFALGSPQILINPRPYVGMARSLQQAGQAAASATATATEEPILLDKLPFYGQTLLYGVGIVLLALGVAGAFRRLILAVKAGDRVSISLLLFPAIYLALIFSTGYRFARYILPIVPFIALFAAEAILAVWKLVRQARLRWGLATLMVVAAVAQPLAQSVRHDLLLTREDTRTLAKRWIEATIPEGSRIAGDGPPHGPPLSTPEYAVPFSARVYDVHAIGSPWTSDHPLTWYEEQGFDYLIASSFIYRMWPKSRYPAQSARNFSLGDEFTLIQEFRPYQGDIELPYVFNEIYGPAVGLWHRQRPGPTIKIYKVQ